MAIKSGNRRRKLSGAARPAMPAQPLDGEYRPRGYYVARNGCAYWKPTLPQRLAGASHQPLGLPGDDAKLRAEQLNAAAREGLRERGRNNASRAEGFSNDGENDDDDTDR